MQKNNYKNKHEYVNWDNEVTKYRRVEYQYFRMCLNWNNYHSK